MPKLEKKFSETDSTYSLSETIIHENKFDKNKHFKTNSKINISNSIKFKDSFLYGKTPLDIYFTFLKMNYY